MKKKHRMNAKSPDPDDLAGNEPPKPAAQEPKANKDRRQRPEEQNQDRSAPHIPPADE